MIHVTGRLSLPTSSVRGHSGYVLPQPGASEGWRRPGTGGQDDSQAKERRRPPEFEGGCSPRAGITTSQGGVQEQSSFQGI